MNLEQVKIKLLSRIKKDDSGCWNFVGAKRSGYGAVSINNKTYGTHRLSYLIFKGELGDKHVCHKCDNKACINPAHLFLGTHSDNMVDALNKGRMFIPEGTPFEKGHRPESSSMYDEKALEVKNAINNRKEAKETLKDIASRFDIKYQTVRDISAGRCYVNI